MPADLKSRGKIVSVQGPVVDVKFSAAEDVPNIFTMLTTKTVDGNDVILEIAEHLPGNLARCIAINSTTNLQRNQEVDVSSGSIQIPVGDKLYGRIINILGEPIDQKGVISAPEKYRSEKRKWARGLS